jgi:hypothetical protein
MVFRDMTPYWLAVDYRRLGGACCRHFRMVQKVEGSRPLRNFVNRWSQQDDILQKFVIFIRSSVKTSNHTMHWTDTAVAESTAIHRYWNGRPLVGTVLSKFNRSAIFTTTHPKLHLKCYFLVCFPKWMFPRRILHQNSVCILSCPRNAIAKWMI